MEVFKNYFVESEIKKSNRYIFEKLTLPGSNQKNISALLKVIARIYSILILDMKRALFLNTMLTVGDVEGACIRAREFSLPLFPQEDGEETIRRVQNAAVELEKAGTYEYILSGLKGILHGYKFQFSKNQSNQFYFSESTFKYSSFAMDLSTATLLLDEKVPYKIEQKALNFLNDIISVDINILVKKMIFEGDMVNE